MCTTCGCGARGGHMHTHVDENGNVTTHYHDAHDHDHHHHDDHDHPHDHSHDHDHGHHHHHHHDAPQHSHAATTEKNRAIQIEEDILSRNNEVANRLRREFAKKRILALNLVSSPGSGKTELLAQTLKRILAETPAAVIEGDQQTDNDAERIRVTGAKAIQINTGKGCHLDATMVEHAMGHLDLEENSILFIENVGNLVCPAEFDLGEAHKVVLLSSTEGDDKPLKYPDMFRAADLMILTKSDLLPYVPFDADKAEENAKRVNPKIRCLRVSALKGDGMDRWEAWLQAQRLVAGL